MFGLVFAHAYLYFNGRTIIITDVVLNILHVISYHGFESKCECAMRSFGYEFITRCNEYLWKVVIKHKFIIR